MHLFNLISSKISLFLALTMLGSCLAASHYWPEVVVLDQLGQEYAENHDATEASYKTGLGSAIQAVLPAHTPTDENTKQSLDFAEDPDSIEPSRTSGVEESEIHLLAAVSPEAEPNIQSADPEESQSASLEDIKISDSHPSTEADLDSQIREFPNQFKRRLYPLLPDSSKVIVKIILASRYLLNKSALALPAEISDFGTLHLRILSSHLTFSLVKYGSNHTNRLKFAESLLCNLTTETKKAYLDSKDKIPETEIEARNLVDRKFRFYFWRKILVLWPYEKDGACTVKVAVLFNSFESLISEFKERLLNYAESSLKELEDKELNGKEKIQEFLREILNLLPLLESTPTYLLFLSSFPPNLEMLSSPFPLKSTEADDCMYAILFLNLLKRIGPTIANDLEAIAPLVPPQVDMFLFFKERKGRFLDWLLKKSKFPLKSVIDDSIIEFYKEISENYDFLDEPDLETISFENEKALFGHSFTSVFLLTNNLLLLSVFFPAVSTPIQSPVILKMMTALYDDITRDMPLKPVEKPVGRYMAYDHKLYEFDIPFFKTSFKFLEPELQAQVITYRCLFPRSIYNLLVNDVHFIYFVAVEKSYLASHYLNFFNSDEDVWGFLLTFIRDRQQKASTVVYEFTSSRRANSKSMEAYRSSLNYKNSMKDFWGFAAKIAEIYYFKKDFTEFKNQMRNFLLFYFQWFISKFVSFIRFKNCFYIRKLFTKFKTANPQYPADFDQIFKKDDLITPVLSLLNPIFETSSNASTALLLILEAYGMLAAELGEITWFDLVKDDVFAVVCILTSGNLMKPSWLYRLQFLQTDLGDLSFTLNSSEAAGPKVPFWYLNSYTEPDLDILSKQVQDLYISLLSSYSITFENYRELVNIHLKNNELFGLAAKAHPPKNIAKIKPKELKALQSAAKKKFEEEKSRSSQLKIQKTKKKERWAAASQNSGLYSILELSAPSSMERHSTAPKNPDFVRNLKQEKDKKQKQKKAAVAKGKPAESDEPEITLRASSVNEEEERENPKGKSQVKPDENPMLRAAKSTIAIYIPTISPPLLKDPEATLRLSRLIKRNKDNLICLGNSPNAVFRWMLHPEITISGYYLYQICKIFNLRSGELKSFAELIQIADVLKMRMEKNKTGTSVKFYSNLQPTNFVSGHFDHESSRLSRLTCRLVMDQVGAHPYSFELEE